ncbi:MAG: replication initiation protein [Methylococcales bacterium]|nr:replication initiation protein [Methylococcales bacterium]
MGIMQSHHNLPTPESSLLHFMANLPPKPYCSSDLSRLAIRPARTARNYAYIQPNDPYNTRWLVFDMDLGAESFHRFEDAGTATPNLIVQNPENLNCHFLYWLKNPIWVKNTGKQAPQAYLNAVKIAMTQQLGADSRYSGLICKNPLSREWRTTELHNRPYSLDDLSKHLDLSLPSIEKDRAKAEKGLINAVINGRNDRLFTVLRLFAYERVARYKGLEGSIGSSKAFAMWQNAIEKEAMRINTDFSNTLPYSEIKSTTKSVSRWTWEHYDAGTKAQRGKMGFGETRNTNIELPMLPEEERKRRQSLSAHLTHKHRKETTELKIIHAIERLKASGEKVTNSAIAKQAGLNRQTMIKNYSDFIAKKVSLMVAIR